MNKPSERDRFDKTFKELWDGCDGREGYDRYVKEDVWNFILEHDKSLLSKLKEEVEGMKIEWIKGKIEDKEAIRLRNIVNERLDKVLSLLERG